MRGRGSSVVLCALLALALGLMVAACGSDDSGGGSSSGGATGSEKGSTEGAKKIDLSLKDNAKGAVRYCQGKDTAGDLKDWVKKFNAQNTGVTVVLVEFSPDAGQQRQSFVQRQEAKSGDCDMFSSDVIWTAEFASQKWLYDMTEYVEKKKDQYIPATLGDDHLRRQDLGLAPHLGRGVPLLPHRPGQVGSGDVAGRLQAGRLDRTASSTRARPMRA